MRYKSLTKRIITYSGSWVIMALIIVGLLLVYLYLDHVAQHYDEHVNMHLEELTEASRLSPDGTFSLAFLPSDPRYHELHSGWYWEVRQSGVSLLKSPSLGDYMMVIGSIRPTGDRLVYEVSGPMQELLRLHVFEIQLDSNQDPLVYLASVPTTDYKDDVLDYANHIFSSFVLLGVFLLLTLILQVRLTLKPLNALGAEISDIRAGKKEKLSQDYPTDVQPLVDELNNLLDHNIVLLKRARNQLGDLAHSVKNPLTVINNEARNMPSRVRDLVLRQTNAIKENINHYLSRARAFGGANILGTRCGVKGVVDDLVYTMLRLHHERELEYDTSKLEECCFRGESQDLEEMLGNLIDNACKWAKSQVMITGKVRDERLLLIVADDGPGIPDDEIGNVVLRGHRLDESKPGHGQGLGIVNDISGLYGGSLKLSRSALGGLRAELNLPSCRLMT